MSRRRRTTTQFHFKMLGLPHACLILGYQEPTSPFPSVWLRYDGGRLGHSDFPLGMLIGKAELHSLAAFLQELISTDRSKRYSGEEQE